MTYSAPVSRRRLARRSLSFFSVRLPTSNPMSGLAAKVQGSAESVAVARSNRPPAVNAPKAAAQSSVPGVTSHRARVRERGVRQNTNTRCTGGTHRTMKIAATSCRAKISATARCGVHLIEDVLNENERNDYESGARNQARDRTGASLARVHVSCPQPVGQSRMGFVCCGANTPEPPPEKQARQDGPRRSHTDVGHQECMRRSGQCGRIGRPRDAVEKEQARVDAHRGGSNNCPGQKTVEQWV